MQKFRTAIQLGQLCKAFLKVILDRLDVMVGHRLDLLDAGGGCLVETIDQLVEEFACLE